MSFEEQLFRAASDAADRASLLSLCRDLRGNVIGQPWNLATWRQMWEALGAKLLTVSSVSVTGISNLHDMPDEWPLEVRLTVNVCQRAQRVDVELRYVGNASVRVVLTFTGALPSHLASDRLFVYWLRSFAMATGDESLFTTVDALVPAPLQPYGVDEVAVHVQKQGTAFGAPHVHVVVSSLAPSQMPYGLLGALGALTWDMRLETSFTVGQGDRLALLYGEIVFAEAAFEVTARPDAWHLVEGTLAEIRAGGAPGRRVTRRVATIASAAIARSFIDEGAPVLTDLPFVWTAATLQADALSGALRVEAQAPAQVLSRDRTFAAEECVLTLDARMTREGLRFVCANLQGFYRHPGKEWASWFEIQVARGDAGWRSAARASRDAAYRESPELTRLIDLLLMLPTLFATPGVLTPDQPQVIFRDEQRGGAYADEIDMETDDR